MELFNNLEGKLLFAVPKKGRLQQAALTLLEGADIQFRREPRLDITLVKNLDIALIFLPAVDIPTFVGEGRVSLGITGRDTVEEHRASIGLEDSCEEVIDLGFGGCKLQVQVPVEGKYQSPTDLIGANIGTSFVHLTENYFKKLESEQGAVSGETANGDVTNGELTNGIAKTGEQKLRTKIIPLSGSVEAACAMRVADGIVDLVESGDTMKAAGLKAIDTVVDSTAVLIKSKNPTNPELVELIASRIRGVIAAQKYVLCQYNVQRSNLDKAKIITPGNRAPTISSLEEEGWVAVSSMVEKKKIATVMDQLTAIGALDILVLKIDNTRAN